MSKVIESPEVIRRRIRESMASAVESLFPIVGKRYTATVVNLNVRGVSPTPAEVKQKLLSKGNPSDGIFGDIYIVDNITDAQVGMEKNMRIMSVPYYTDRWTFLVEGNEYLVVNQFRTKSGIYTRKKDNEELEVTFNLERGANFKLLMDGTTGILKISILGNSFLLFALFQILGASETEIRKVLGDELFIVNQRMLTKAQYDRAVHILFTKVATYKGQSTFATPEEAIQDYFLNKTLINGDTTRITLGSSVTSVNLKALLLAVSKLISVYKGEKDPDDRDSLEFQKLYTVEDIVKETIQKNKGITIKIKHKLDSYIPGGDVKGVIGATTLSKPFKTFLTSSTISRLPQQINPMEMVDGLATVTRLGEGAISSETAAPDAARSIHPSYVGILDLYATPESSKVGLDSRLAINVRKGDNNEIERVVRNLKTGKVEVKSVLHLYDKKVAFPDALHTVPLDNDKVKVIYKGNISEIKRSEADYIINTPEDLLTNSTSTIPFINSIQGNRILMGAKHVQQALPLVDPDARIVSTGTRVDKAFQNVKAPVTGIITEVSANIIKIETKNGGVTSVDFERSTPLATKTRLDNTPIVKPGDLVKQGQPLTSSNFERDGELALGKNLTIAYMPYKGLNHEDGIVISETASIKLTSAHTTKLSIEIQHGMVLSKAKCIAQFPAKYTQAQLDKIGENGVAIKGSYVEKGDPLIMLLSDNSDSKMNQVLGQLHKSLLATYRSNVEEYEETFPGIVDDVFVSAKLVTLIVNTNKPAVIGDKLSGSFGNKGVIVKILPDDAMIQDQEGNAMDALFTSAGVISRVNPAQIEETLLGKVGQKTGIKYKLDNYSHDNNLAYVEGEMAAAGISDKETLIDPATGKKIPNITTGTQHIFKLYKTTDSNFSARGVEGVHDMNDVPTGSGENAPKAIGGMEVNVLLAHNARNLLQEGTMLRGQRNNEFWKQFQYGIAPTPPNVKESFSRFSSILNQAGVKITREGDNLTAGPLTDKDIMEKSSGEIKSGLRLSAKLKPETGGLFDEAVTGGLSGDRWGHITLPEPVVNPIFLDSSAKVLNMSNKDMLDFYFTEGGGAVRDTLNSLNVEEELATTISLLSTCAATKIDGLIKRKKLLEALIKADMKAGDAYTLSVLPVTPPKYRPITVQNDGDIMENDANSLYRDTILQRDNLKNTLPLGMPDMSKEARAEMFQRVKELTGVTAPKSGNRSIKGALDFIAGDRPKTGFFQKKVMYNQMNFTGRGTIAPDVNLGLDEVGLPEDMAWVMYKPILLNKLTGLGFSGVDARQHVEDRSETALRLLEEEMKIRPVLINRAPSLWKYSIIAAYPKMVTGKTILVNTLWEAGTNADFDGDAMTVHLPVTDGGIADAKRMLPSKLVFSDKRKGDLLYAPKTEPIMGLYKATKNLGKDTPPSSPIRSFKNLEAAWKSYHANELEFTDLVKIG